MGGRIPSRFEASLQAYERKLLPRNQFRFGKKEHQQGDASQE